MGSERSGDRGRCLPTVAGSLPPAAAYQTHRL